MRAAPALFVCALAALPAAGCGDIDGGSQPFPGTILYQDPNGAFEFRLLEPPWLPPFIVTFMDLSMTFSVVPPPDATVTTDPTSCSPRPSTACSFSASRAIRPRRWRPSRGAFPTARPASRPAR